MNIEPYQDQYKNLVISLLGSKDNSAYETKSRIWDWQYLHNPFSDPGTIGLVVKEGSEVLGFNGFIPVVLRYNGKEIRALWSCDTILVQSCRGKGYGDSLLGSVTASSPIVMAIGASEAQAHIALKHGYVMNGEIEQFFYTLGISHVRDLAKKLAQLLTVVKSMGRKVGRANLKASTMEVSSLPNEIDALWTGVEGGYTKIVRRDYSYINWKYGSHPSKKYHCIVVRQDAEIVGLGIFRKSKELSRLIDYVGPAKSAMVKQLITKVFKEECCQSQMLECTSSDEEFKRSLACLGFRKYRGRPGFYIHSAIVGDQDPEKDWFVMGGDSDGDL